MGKIEFENDRMYYVDENGNKEKVVFEAKKLKSLLKISKGKSKYNGNYLLNNEGMFPVFSSNSDEETKGIYGYINTYDYDEESLQFTSNGNYAGTVFLIKKMKFSMNGDRGKFDLINKNDYLNYYYYLMKYLFSKLNYNWGNKPSNEKLEKEISILHIKKEIQQAISDYIEKEYSEIDKKIDILETMILLLKEEKELILENIF